MFGDMVFEMTRSFKQKPYRLRNHLDRLYASITINVIPLVRHVGGTAHYYVQGAHFVVTPQQSVPARYIDPKAKNRSRIYYQLANLQAQRMEDGASALLTDEHGFITEGTGNNFFIVLNGEILTPKPHDILRGISRQACMELAERLNIPVRETNIEPYDVRDADEAWYTSTTICMVPITRFQLSAGRHRPSRTRVSTSH